MKRIVALVTIIAILSLMLATFVHADDNANLPQWFKDMISWRKAQVELDVKDGTITNEQAKLYKDHIDQMEKFHSENGFTNGMGFGACGGSRSSNNTGYGFGRGMMNGFRYPIQ
ncbi:MAG: DUF2680 domain-containing protein [Clostridia bacterium]